MKGEKPTRRDTLRTGMIVAGGLTLGVTASGSVAGQPGDGNPNRVVLESDDDWITATVQARAGTHIWVELDDGVYADWPDNPTSYVLEANVDIDSDGLGGDDEDDFTDDFRIGWGGSASEARTGAGTAGGYIRRHTSVGRRYTLEEDVQGAFSVEESTDQQSYHIFINWNSPLPDGEGGSHRPRPDAIVVNEVFGLDGGEGVQNENIDVTTEASEVLEL